jgi:2-C-methyl-D-erythritol 2,4-cyclodiphosphate synthase
MNKHEFRVGQGYDSHRLVVGRPLVIGGVVIPHHKGFAAHSDGDILIHAICDALLGAASLPDIGTHFANTDPQFKDIDSKILLQKTVALIHAKGFIIHNLDCTIIIEKPKMSPHIEAMRAYLAPLLHIEPTELALKAKTNETMGFIGREEGAVAMACVSLYRQ